MLKTLGILLLIVALTPIVGGILAAGYFIAIGISIIGLACFVVFIALQAYEHHKQTKEDGG